MLGVIFLNDVNLLEHESNTGRGWIASPFFVPLPLILPSPPTDLARYDLCRVQQETAVLRPRPWHDTFLT
jgi:hypothetical protein